MTQEPLRLRGVIDAQVSHAEQELGGEESVIAACREKYRLLRHSCPSGDLLIRFAVVDDRPIAPAQSRIGIRFFKEWDIIEGRVQPVGEGIE